MWPELHAETKAPCRNLYLCTAAVEHVGAVQEVLVLGPGHHRLWQFSQVQLEQRCHRVDIGVTAGTGDVDMKSFQLT